jgi:hypothetical protein
LQTIPRNFYLSRLADIWEWLRPVAAVRKSVPPLGILGWAILQAISRLLSAAFTQSALIFSISSCVVKLAVSKT